MQDLLFYVSAALSVASFGLFALLALRETEPRQKVREMTLEAGLPDPGAVADIAEKFQKAGPRATAATLSVFFLLVATAASGVVAVAVGGP
jgi:hypothetical protein